MAVRILSTRKGLCHCGHRVRLRTIATDVEDALPIEVLECGHCDRIRG